MFKSKTLVALNKEWLLLTNIGDERGDKGGDGGAFGLRLHARVGPVGMMQQQFSELCLSH